MRTTGTVLACDIGGTRIKLGLVRSGRVLAREEFDAKASEGLEQALKRIARAARRLCRTASVSVKKLSGLGLAFPGIIKPATGQILSTPVGKFDDAKHLDVPRLVKQLMGLPMLICNDANAALQAEWKRGAARGYASAVIMTLGTGIGTSAIIEGVPLYGQHGQAGILGGHLTVNLAGRTCTCGNVGCAESEASTSALPAQAAAHPGFAASQLARNEKLDYESVFSAADAGDEVACGLRERAIGVWSIALVNLIHAYDPECAVVGGGIITGSGPFILPRLRRYVARHAWTPWGRVRIKPALLGNDAGIVGVAGLVMDRL